MHEITVDLMQSFVDSGRGGNTAGIVYPADHLSCNEKAIYCHIGRNLRDRFHQSFRCGSIQVGILYTQQANSALWTCDHCCILLSAPTRSAPEGWTSKETIDGIRKIIIDGNQAFMQQLKPDYRPSSHVKLQTY